jgi:hypothetical protein
MEAAHSNTLAVPVSRRELQRKAQTCMQISPFTAPPRINDGELLPVFFGKFNFHDIQTQK